MVPGEVVLGRFEIEGLAGRGGMGSVYRARDRDTGEVVAIKVQAGRGDAESRRWAREAALLAQLSGPGIVRYLSHGRTPTGDLYLMMEWLDGEDLATRLDHDGLTVSESLAVVSRAAAALEPAHSQGIAHRDIKPGNIFLVDRDIERIKIIDFGIARVGGVTRSTVHGTPGYVAPEQARGDTGADPRTDVFALGCVLFECLTGRPAFVGDHPMALLAKILFDESPRPSDVRSELPLELDALVARMMAKDPADRPANGAALAAEIAALHVSARLPPRPVDRRPTVLTKSEQRIVFVVTVGSTGSDARVGTPGQTLEASTDVAPEIRTVARSYGGVSVPLADGSTVVTLEAAGTANDQAIHAARCALALRTIAPDVSLALAMGRASEGGRLPIGDVVDRSWRLIRDAHRERSASILLDPAIVGLLDGRFALRDRDGIATLEAEKRRIEQPRTLLGRPTICVGRERELAELAATLDECIADSVARAVLVTAPAGVGKSRLLHEHLAEVRGLARPPDIWVGYGDPMRAGSPFGLLGQAIRNAAEIHDGEPVAIRRARIKARVARHVAEPDRQRVAEFLGELVGAPFPADDSVQLRAARGDPMVMRDQLARAWSDWLAAETAVGPVLIVLEDIHWGDLPSLRFVDAALRTVRDKPWMVLALGRPDVHDVFPRLWIDRRVREIRLEELSRRAAGRLVRSALGEHVAIDVVERLVERAAGVPFYLEELIRAEARGRGETPPETVLAMLQARLDRLPGETRRILRAASVFGQAFHRGGVAELCGVGAPVREALEELEEQELVERRGEGELVFRHALLREAAYGTLTAGDRVLGHRLAGQWLEDKGESDAMVLAEHYERGGDSARAVRWFLRAAEQALDGSDLDAVIERAERGVTSGARGEALGALRLLQSEAQLWRGDLANAERQVILAMEHLPNGSTRWYRAALGLLMQSANRGQEQETARVIGELAASEQHERSAAQTMAFALALRLLAMEGRLDGARTFADRLEAIDREVRNEPAITAMVSGGLFYWWSYVDWDPWKRKQVALRCARESELVGDQMNAAMARVHVGWACLALGEFEEAHAVLDDNLAIATARGLGGLISDFTRLHLGAAAAALGRIDEGIGLETDAIARLLDAGNWLYAALARVELARMLLHAGSVVAAEGEARKACDELVRVAPVRVGALAVHAQALLALGEPHRALEVARIAATSVERAGTVMESEPRLRLVLADALVAAGAVDEAAQVCRRAAESLIDRSRRIADPEAAQRFLSRVPEHAALVQRAGIVLSMTTS